MRDLDPIRTPAMVNSSPRRRASAFLLPLVAIPLAACSATKSATTIASPRTLAASEAMILPAPGGPVVISVIEERFSDAAEQKVVLATDAGNPGENYLGIRLYGPMERETQGVKKLGYREFTSATISGEIARQMPGVPMKVSELFLRNSYGPFGYAFGHTATGDSCIYGWQQLRSSEAERSAYRNVGAIQIRLRLCERGASEKELLSVMYGYTVNGSFWSAQWNPFGQPKDAAATVGVNGAPIYPRESELWAPQETAVARPARRSLVVEGKNTETTPVQVGMDEEKSVRPRVTVPAPTEEEGAEDRQTADPPADGEVTVPVPD